jgi:hypothetical protein
MEYLICVFNDAKGVKPFLSKGRKKLRQAKIKSLL